MGSTPASRPCHRRVHLGARISPAASGAQIRGLLGDGGSPSSDLEDISLRSLGDHAQDSFLRRVGVRKPRAVNDQPEPPSTITLNTRKGSAGTA